jgi:hypothetical protein
MKYVRSLLVMTAAALGGLLAIPAFAIGTQADTPVTNSVQLNYAVNGFAQAQQTASVQFVVDRAIATLVAAQGANAVQVTPGQLSAGASAFPALNFDVTNTGNDTQDLWLALIDRGALTVPGLGGQGTGAAFVDPAPIVAIDSNNNGAYDDTVDPVLALSGGHYVLSGRTRDQITRILVVVNVPTATLDGARAAFTLVAGVAAPGGAFIGGDTSGHNAPGFAVATNVADVIGGPAQDVFADVSGSSAEDLTWDFGGNAAGAQDIQYNGQHADTTAFVVNAAELYIGKVVEVLWDPVNGNKYQNNTNTLTGANPKSIPGAVLMYAVGVQNLAGSPSATAVNVSDNLQSTGEIAAGNPGNASVAVPDTVSVTLNAVPVAFDVPANPNLGEISYRQCATPGTVDTAAFAGGDPEIAVSLGACAAAQTGVIVYFVTVQ